MIDGAIQIVVGFITTFVNTIIDWFEKLYQKLVGGSIVPDMVNAIIEWFTTLGDRVKELVDELVAKVIDLVITLKDKVVKTIEDLWDEWVDLVTTLRDKIVELFIELKDRAVSKVDDLKNSVLEILGTLVRGMYEQGRALVQGLIDGVASMAQALIDAAVGVVNSAIEAARNLLNMHSPSMVFFDIGEGAMEGFVLGVLSMGQEVLGAVIEVLGEVDEVAAEQAASIARAMETILGVLVAAVEAVNALAEATLPEVSIGGTIDRLALMLRDMMTQFIAAVGTFEEEGLAAAQAFAETAGAVLEMIGQAVENLAKFQTFNARFDYFMAGMWRLKATIVNLVNWLVAVAGGLYQEGVPAAQMFAETAGLVLGMIGQAVDSLTKFQAFNANVDYFELGMWRLKATIVNLVNWLVAVAGGLYQEGVPAAQLFAETAGLVLDMIGQAVDSLTKFQAFDANVDYFEAGMWRLKATIVNLVNWLVAVGGEVYQEGVPAARLFAEMAGLVLGMIGQGVDALAKLAEYVSPENLTDLADAFVGDILIVAVALHDALSGATDEMIAAYDQAAAFGQRIGAIVGVISPGMTALKALGEYVRAENIARSVQDFAADIITVAMELRSALGAPSDDLLALYDQAAAFGQRIGAIVGVISPGMTALKALGEYVRAQNIARSVQDFASDVLLVAETLREALSGATPEMLAAYDAAAAFGQRVTAVFQAIRPALELLRELSNYGGPSNIHTGMQTFLRHVEGVMNTLGTTMERLGPDTVARAVAFSDAVRLMVENMRAAMAGASGLNTIYDGALAVAQGWMDGLIDGITSRMDDLEQLMAYIRGLFPSSPAEHGPWQNLPQGQDVALPWLNSLSQALGQTTGLESALAGIHGLFNGSIGELTPAWAVANTGSQPVRPGVVNIAINGPFHIREEADIQRLAEAVGNELAGQADVRWRLGAAF
ncbi:MAG TPA: hypothetical protein VL334_06545 [Anaerolineae bacterium]|nr:hypothetical protein [Anaerolineae bacterium]